MEQLSLGSLLIPPSGPTVAFDEATIDEVVSRMAAAIARSSTQEELTPMTPPAQSHKITPVHLGRKAVVVLAAILGATG